MGLHKVSTRRRDPGCKPPDELKRGERHARGAVRPRPLESHSDESGRGLLQPGTSEGGTSKRMFGGVAFMVRGHMTAGVNGDDLMVRVGKPDMTKCLARPFVRPMDFTGVPLAGFIYVGR